MHCAQKLIGKIAKDNNLTEYEEIDNTRTAKGENFIGIVESVGIKGKRGEEDVEMRLIVKFAPSVPIRRMFFNCEQCFKREIYMYEELLPLFTRFELERGIQRPFKYPKLFATCKTELCEALVLQNLFFDGFKMKNRTEVMDLNHYKAAIRGLAQLHSISFAMRHQEPALFNTFNEFSEFFYSSNFFTEPSVAGFFQRVYICMDEEKDEEVLNKIKWLERNYVKCLEFCTVSEERKKYGVIGHGDTWSNNMFFEYKDDKDPNYPTGVCFVDWQLSRLASPVLDIVYFLYSSTDSNFRTTHAEDLYEEYYSSLSQHLLLLGTPISKVFPYEAYREELKKYAHFGQLTALCLLHIILAKTGEADSEMICSDKDTYIEKVIDKAKYDKEYRKRMQGVVYELCKKEWDSSVLYEP